MSETTDICDRLRDIEIDVERLYAALYRQASKFARGEDLDDLVQDTWVRALSNLHQVREAKNVGAWLIQILKHVSIDRFRKRTSPSTDYIRHIESSCDWLCCRTDNMLNDIVRREDMKVLDALHNELPPTMQTFMRTALGLAWNRQEIAAALKITPEMVDRNKQRLFAYAKERSASAHRSAIENGMLVTKAFDNRGLGLTPHLWLSLITIAYMTWGRIEVNETTCES